MDEPSVQTLLREGIAAAKLAQQKPDPAGDSPKEQARALLLRVTELDEQNILAWLWLSTVLDAVEEKRTCLENVLVLEPDHPHALAGLARLKGAAPPPPQPAPPPVPPSRSKYTRLKPRNSSPAQSPPAKSRLQSRKTQAAPAKRSGPACPFCDETISAIDKSCPHCQLPLVMNCPDCGAAVDVEQKACSDCGRAMGRYRQPLPYFSGLGEAYRESGHHQEALKAWQAVEMLNPAHPRLHLHLGEAHLGLGRPDRAWASLQQALEQNPNDAELHFALGELARQRGAREEAFEHYQRTTQLDPQYGPAWFQIGQLYQQVRRSKEASQAYQRAAKLLPADSAEHRQLRGQLDRLAPGLPEGMALGWGELIRQMAGPVILCLLAALLDSGLRPWWIPLTGWLALFLAVPGAFFYVSGADLPRNPLIRWLAGEQGLVSSESKLISALLGAGLWLLALLLILLPVGQSFPEPPQL